MVDARAYPLQVRRLSEDEGGESWRRFRISPVAWATGRRKARQSKTLEPRLSHGSRPLRNSAIPAVAGMAPAWLTPVNRFEIFLAAGNRTVACNSIVLIFGL